MRRHASSIELEPVSNRPNVFFPSPRSQGGRGRCTVAIQRTSRKPITMDNERISRKLLPNFLDLAFCSYHTHKLFHRPTSSLHSTALLTAGDILHLPSLSYGSLQQEECQNQ